ncbi:MAG: DUF1232 domain-containing protein [Prevotellaceae bacterium]|nr:DUF1232 domain-containing protein [Prevotellaceae bacterium]
MDYAKLFKKGGWASMGRYYLMHPKKMKALLANAKKYASKEGMSKAKGELLFICQYVKDVVTRRYKDYNLLNLIVIVGALVYVVTPIDLMPDFIPMGLIDDTAILLWAVAEFSDELGKYKQWKATNESPQSSQATT